jgi:hypothetical protein
MLVRLARSISRHRRAGRAGRIGKGLPSAHAFRNPFAESAREIAMQMPTPSAAGALRVGAVHNTGGEAASSQPDPIPAHPLSALRLHNEARRLAIAMSCAHLDQ